VASSEKLCLPTVLDFDELMTICANTGASPLIVVAYDAMYNTTAGTGKPTKSELITNAVEWVRYANISKGFGIKYWMIGNESWNSPTYNGTATPAQYAADLVDFASAMKAVDPTIKIIANGKSDWWQTLLQSSAAQYIDVLGFSNYPIWNYIGGYEYYRTNNVNLTSEADAAITALNNYGTTADKARIKVMPTEYNSIDWSGNWTSENNLGHALCNFQMFGDLVIKPKVESLCMWNTRWMDNITSDQHLYDAVDENSNLNAAGTALKVWGTGLLQTMVTATSNNSMVKAYASYSSTHSRLNLFLLNKDNTAKTVNLTLSNYIASYNGVKWQFKGTGAAGKFPTFTYADTIYNASSLTGLSLPANSVTLIKLHTPTTTLPLILKSFTALPTDGKIQLNWTGEELDNFSHYEIEKRVNSTDLKKIGSVPGTSSGQHGYVFSDGNYNAGVPAYYRLKMIDKDGSFSYSKLIFIKPSSKKNHLAITPISNPVKEYMVFRIRSERSDKVAILITDQLGREILRKNMALVKGDTRVELPETTNLPKGVYNVRVTGERFAGSTTIIK
jgi:hypothetical protein